MLYSASLFVGVVKIVSEYKESFHSYLSVEDGDEAVEVVSFVCEEHAEFCTRLTTRVHRLKNRE